MIITFDIRLYSLLHISFPCILQIARPVGEELDDRPWSRYSKGSSAYNKVHAVSKDKESSTEKRSKDESSNHGQDIAEDPELNEFLQVMQPRSKSKLWANDSLTGKDQKDHVKKQKNEAKKHSKSGKSKNEKKTKGINSTDKQENYEPIMELNGDDESYESSEASSKDEFEHEELVTEDTEVTNALVDDTISDLDYLKQRVRGDWSEDESDANSGNESENDTVTESESESKKTHLSKENTQASSVEEKMGEDLVDDTLENVSMKSNTQNGHTEEVVADHQETVGETGRLFVRNLSYTTRYRYKHIHFMDFYDTNAD